MRKSLSVILACIIVALLCACGNNAVKGNILPKEIENIDKDPHISEGQEAYEHDNSQFPPGMFCGRWIRQDSESVPETIEIPSLNAEGGSRSVECMPVALQFSETQETYGTDTFRNLDLGDQEYAQAEFAAADTPEETIVSRVIFDTAGDLLAIGVTGLELTESSGLEKITGADIFELDYKIRWEGSSLVLSFGDSEAVYRPSMIPQDLSQLSFRGRFYDQQNPGIDITEISIEGSECTIGTLYSDRMTGTITFEENGSVTIKTDEGDEWSFGSFWISDMCLTLERGGEKYSYYYISDNFGISYLNEKYANKLVHSSSLCMQGHRCNELLLAHTGALADFGMYTDVEVNSIEVPSGRVTEPFEVYYGNARLNVRAVNCFDAPVPLAYCRICWFEFDDTCGDISIEETYLEDPVLTCGMSRREIPDYCNNLYELDDGSMSAGFLLGSPKEDKDAGSFAEENNCTEVPVEEMYGEMLASFDESGSLNKMTFYVPGLMYDHLTEHMRPADVMRCSRSALAELGKKRDAIAEAVNKSEIGSIPGIKVSERSGAVIIANDLLFVHGKNALSDEGKELLDSFLSAYLLTIFGNKASSDIESIDIISHTGIGPESVMENLSRQYADVVCSYLSERSAADCTEDENKFRTLASGSGRYYTSPGVTAGDGSDACIEITYKLKPSKAKKNPGLEEISLGNNGTGDGVSFLQELTECVSGETADILRIYAGSISEKEYTNDEFGIQWTLPEGWRFYQNRRMESFNNGSAADLLARRQPVYIMAASDSGDRQQVSMRLYIAEKKEEGLTENMHQNYLHYYQALFGNVKEEFTEEKINGRKIPRSVYSFYWDGRQVTRTNYYFSGEKALLVAGITVPEGGEGPGNLFRED